MSKQKDSPKVPFTFRLAPEKLARLRELAEQIGSTPSQLMEKAISESLDRCTVTPPVQNTGEEVHLDSSDIQRVGPVVEAMGVSIPVSLFLEIVRVQRSK